VLQCVAVCLSHQQPSGELTFAIFGFWQRAAANSTVNSILSHPSTSAAPPHTPTATSSPAGLGAGTSSVTPKGGEGGEGGLGVSRTFVATSEEWSVCVFNDCVGFNVPLAQVVVSLRMYLYVCICIHMYVYTHVCGICIYLYVCIQYAYVYICMCIHIYVVCVYICIYIYIRTSCGEYAYVYICMYIHMYVVCIHMSIHKCVVHAYICMYSYMYEW